MCMGVCLRSGKLKAENTETHRKKTLRMTLLNKYREYYKVHTKEEMKKKINALITNFRKELKKVNDYQKSGARAGEV